MALSPAIPAHIRRARKAAKAAKKRKPRGRCDRCHQLFEQSELIHGNEPYQEDVNGVIQLVTYCHECWRNSCEDI